MYVRNTILLAVLTHYGCYSGVVTVADPARKREVTYGVTIINTFYVLISMLFILPGEEVMFNLIVEATIEEAKNTASYIGGGDNLNVNIG